MILNRLRRGIIANDPFHKDDFWIADSFDNPNFVGDPILHNGIAILSIWRRVKKRKNCRGDSEAILFSEGIRKLRILVWKGSKSTRVHHTARYFTNKAVADRTSDLSPGSFNFSESKSICECKDYVFIVCDDTLFNIFSQQSRRQWSSQHHKNFASTV